MVFKSDDVIRIGLLYRPEPHWECLAVLEEKGSGGPANVSWGDGGEAEEKVDQPGLPELPHADGVDAISPAARAGGQRRHDEVLRDSHPMRVTSSDLSATPWIAIFWQN